MKNNIRQIFSKGFNSFWKFKKNTFGNYAIVQPGLVTEMKKVPQSIKTPSYYCSGIPIENIENIEIKNEDQIIKMRESCKLAATILKTVGESLKIGQTTDEIDSLVHNLITEKNAYPSPLNYHHYPKSVCTSVNNVACHGIPDNRALQNGDIINVDITVYYNGYHGDCSKTFLIGEVDDKGKELVKATEVCLNEGISICKPKEKFATIGFVIEKRAREMGYQVVPCFVGHGIGSYFHGPPDIYHFANNYPGIMAPGMTFTIEPILSQGLPDIILLEDNWTAVTSDNARTAQFEHTILITQSGCEVLTDL